MFGRSRSGVALEAVERRGTDAHRPILVVGCVHGDEAAGTAIVDALLQQPLPAHADLILVSTVNPDGQARGRRQNAAGVDLNRNFPYAWRAIGQRGDQQFSGSGPASEPETRAVVALIESLRPAATVWFHQPLDVVDESGGDPALERGFAVHAGQRFARLTRYPGSAASWQDAVLPGSTAFVDELPRPLPAGRVPAFVQAVWWLATRL